jgi:hypothetical protein
MQPRKKQYGKPTKLPHDFIVSVTDLFNKQFKKERAESEFLIYGDLYMNELVFCVSLSNAKTLAAGTMYTSIDLPTGVAEKPEQVTEKLKSLVDVSASWFGQCFAESKEKGLAVIVEALRDQPVGWQSLQWETQQIFVKLSRDNRALDNAADRFLTERGVDLEEEEQTPLNDELDATVGDEDEGKGKGRGHLH